MSSSSADHESVVDLIDRALSGHLSAPSSTPVEGDQAEPTHDSSPDPAAPTTILGHYPASIFAGLYDLLISRLGQTQALEVTQQLRDTLAADLSPPQPEALYRRLTHCTACVHNVVSPPQMPLYNVADPDVVFVIDAPRLGQRGEELLIEGLKNAGFRSTQLTITHAYRCQLTADGDLDTVVTTCVDRFLTAEITALRPKLVVASGRLASQALLNDANLKLKDIRGQIFWVGSYPILPTHSANAALRHETVAHEFFADLQQAHTFVYG